MSAVLIADARAANSKPTSRLQYLLLVSITMQPQARKHFDQAKLQTLGESLKERQIHPITVCPDPSNPGKFLLLDGERRVRAALMALIPGLEARILDRVMTRTEFLEYQLTEDGLREKLLPTEASAAISEWMRATGSKQSDAAKRFGYSQGMISQISNLVANVCKDLQPKIDTELSMSHWLEIGRLERAEQQLEAYAQCMQCPDHPLSRDMLKRWIDQKLGKRKAKGASKPLKGNIGGRSFEEEILPDDSHEKLIEFHKLFISLVQKGQRDGIALKDMGVLFAARGR